MGFRFRKSISIIPGVRLNISKGGFSTSIGRPGATVNIGKRGVRGTVGLPGSGLSYSEMLIKRGRNKSGSLDRVSGSPEQAGLSVGRSVLKWMLFAVLGIVLVLFLRSFLFGPHRSEVGSGGFQPSVQTRAVGTAAGEPITRAEAATVSVTDGVNCRSNPNKRASIVAVLSGREGLQVMDRQGGWTRVTTEDQDCWVSSALVR